MYVKEHERLFNITLKTSLWVRGILIKATSNTISVISWRSVPGENLRSVASHLQTYCVVHLYTD